MFIFCSMGSFVLSILRVIPVTAAIAGGSLRYIHFVVALQLYSVLRSVAIVVFISLLLLHCVLVYGNVYLVYLSLDCCVFCRGWSFFLFWFSSEVNLI